LLLEGGGCGGGEASTAARCSGRVAVWGDSKAVLAAGRREVGVLEVAMEEVEAVGSWTWSACVQGSPGTVAAEEEEEEVANESPLEGSESVRSIRCDCMDSESRLDEELDKIEAGTKGEEEEGPLR
jgi:hypothetical protein